MSVRVPPVVALGIAAAAPSGSPGDPLPIEPAQSPAGSRTGEPGTHGDAGDPERAAAELLDDLDSAHAGDVGAQRRRTERLAGRLRSLGEREQLHSVLVRDEVVSALADTLRECVRLGVPQVGLTLSGAVEVLAQRLGEAHRHALTARFHLAGACMAAGEPGRAATLYEQVVGGTEQLLGADHPQVLTARHGLAGAYRAAGEPERALPLYEQMVEDAARVLGATHPDALSARNNLARACELAGDPQRALALYDELVRDARGVLGEQHPYLGVFQRNRDRVRAAVDEREPA